MVVVFWMPAAGAALIHADRASETARPKRILPIRFGDAVSDALDESSVAMVRPLVAHQPPLLGSCCAACRCRTSIKSCTSAADLDVPLSEVPLQMLCTNVMQFLRQWVDHWWLISLRLPKLQLPSQMSACMEPAIVWLDEAGCGGCSPSRAKPCKAR